MVISTPNAVFICMRQLEFNPGGVKALLMQDGTQRMPETMTRCFAIITDTF